MDIADSLSLAEFFNLLCDSQRSGRVEEICCTHLNCGGTGHEEFQGITPTGYTSKAYYGNFYRFCHLPYHTHRHGAHGRAAESAGNGTQARAAVLYVYSHAHKRIDKADGIGSFVFNGAGYFGDVGNVGTQFYYHGTIPNTA